MRSLFLALLILNGFMALMLQFSGDKGPLPAESAKESQTIQVLSSPRYLAMPTRCIELGPFGAEEINQARRLLDELSLTDRISSVDTTSVAQWLVSIPPRSTRVDALKRVRELEKLGIKDLHVLDENNPLKYAISLGVFRTQAAAQAHLADLVRKGVKGARVDEHQQRALQTAFYATDPDPATIGKLTQVKAQFAAAELRQVSCPAIKKSAN